MTGIHYDLIRRGTKGVLLSDLFQNTPIKGYEVSQSQSPYASLDAFGGLMLHKGFVWDFGSGAIDTPAMVRASAVHDAFCRMTDAGLLPWSVRAQSDKYFRELLKENGVGFARRWWCWTGVRGYSKFVAYWKREK